MEKLYSKEIWWRNYRRVKNGPRDQLSVEMVLRKSLVETVKEFGKHCSLPPMQQLTARSTTPIRRVFWFTTLGVMCVMVLYYFWGLLTDVLTKPLIVTLVSSTYPISQIDFPAVAICNMNRISKKAVKIVALEIKSTAHTGNASLAEIEWFVLQAGRLLDYSYNEALRNHPLLNAVSQARPDTQIVAKRMKQLAPNCTEMLVRCSFDGVRMDCNNMFRVRRTMHGHCCAFNYVLEYNAAGRADRSAGHAIRQSQSGWTNGLNIILNPLLEDYAYPISNLYGFEILLFDPTHFADSSSGRVIQRIAQPNEVLLFELQSTKQIAAEEVRKYPLKARKCLFHDEKPDQFGEMYSYSACLVECRIETIKSLCKCIPYFMPAASKWPMCTLDDLQCLNKYKEKLHYLNPIGSETTQGLEMELQDSLNCPACLPDCEFTRHTTKSSWVPFNLKDPHRDKGFQNNFLKGLNLSDLCLVSIYQPTADGILDRLDVVAYWFEVLSNAGGFAGMLLGLTVINIAELIYYFILYLIQVICTNFRKHY